MPTSFCLFVSALLSNPTEAFAHASDRGHVLLLPTRYYLTGGAAAVAVSFIALLLLPHGTPGALAGWRLRLGTVPSGLRFWTSLASFLVLCTLIAAGLFGSRDPLSNPLPLAIWTMLWIGLTLAVGLFGNLWRWIDPWHAPMRIVDALRRAPSLATCPERLGTWPALALFGGFAWFELIYVAPDDPFRLAIVVAAYWLLTFACMVLFGHEAWSSRGEFLSVFFGMISRLGIVEGRERDGRVHLALRLPAAKLLDEPPLPLSGTLFLLAVLGSVSFDGFSKTFAWLAAIGVNPLEFPGRTVLQTANGIGLLLFCAGLAAAFLLAVWTGAALARVAAWRAARGLLVWSIAPIALAYHFSHYLTALLVNAQYFAVALSDPFDLGWDLFGTAHMLVSAGIAMGSDMAWTVWNLQAFAIIGGHVLAVAVAHAQVSRVRTEGQRRVLLELPLTLLMIAYTVFGLWLLSTPTVG